MQRIRPLELSASSERITVHPEVIPKLGYVRIGHYPGLIHRWSLGTRKITHRTQLPRATRVPTGQIRTVNGKPNGDPACEAASRKVLSCPFEPPIRTSIANDIAPTSGVKSSA